jgi:hypothetical protein
MPGTTTIAPVTNTFGSNRFGDWVDEPGARNGSAKRISKDNKDGDDFGLFETADVWK